MRNRTGHKFIPHEKYGFLVASTQLLIAEIENRGGKVELIDREYNLIKVHVENQEFMVLGTTYTDTTSLLRHMLCEQKDLCKKILRREGFCTPKGTVVSPRKNIGLEQQKYPIVIKPTNTNHGKDVFVGIRSKTKAEEIIQRHFLGKYDKLLLEEYIEGREYRFLLIENKLVGIIERVAANVIGDGRSTFRKLLAVKNEGRGLNYSFPLMQIPECLVENYLKKNNFDIDYIPRKGEIHFFTKVSNLSLGGDSFDRTEEINDYHKRIAAEITYTFDLPIAGIDFIIPDLSKEEYYVIEINERPMISMHSFPYRGKNRKTEKFLLDHLIKSRR